MNKKDLAMIVTQKLKEEYPKAECSLNYNTPFKLLVATRLAAQCTDVRVNIVTSELFKYFETPKDFASASYDKICRLIKSCGLYKTKAKDLIAMAKKIENDFNGKVPDTIEDLISLPGVGRKTANLIIGDIYKKPAVVVDTHCIRITSRLGFHNLKDPYKIELILKEVLNKNESNDFCHRLVMHGRKICKAKNPVCTNCVLNKYCLYYSNKLK